MSAKDEFEVVFHAHRSPERMLAPATGISRENMTISYQPNDLRPWGIRGAHIQLVRNGVDLHQQRVVLCLKL